MAGSTQPSCSAGRRPSVARVTKATTRVASKGAAALRSRWHGYSSSESFQPEAWPMTDHQVKQ